MATNTPNFNLVKPDLNDNVDIAVLNGNMDIIDGALVSVGDLDDLNDVSITSPSYGQVLSYNPTDTNWANNPNNMPVMVFDDSAARTTAIPTPSEGMVTYLKSDDQVTVFDGSAFKPVGGLVAVKHVLKTNAFAQSVGASGNVAVTDLSIAHEVADAANRLIITAVFGIAANSSGFANVGIAVNDGTNFIGIGDASGTRMRVFGGGNAVGGSGSSDATTMLSISFVHTPGAGSKTYTVHAFNMGGGTATVYVGRTQADSTASMGRGASSLIIQEVSV